MKNLKNIIQSTTEPAVNDIWLKDGKLYYFNGKWISISGKSEEYSSEGKIFIIGDINTQTYDFTPSLILEDYEEFKVKSTDASLCVRLVNPELNYNTLATLDVSNDSNTIVFSYAGKYGLLTIYVDDISSKIKFEYNKNIVKDGIRNSILIISNADEEVENVFINNSKIPATDTDLRYLFENFDKQYIDIFVKYPTLYSDEEVMGTIKIQTFYMPTHNVIEGYSITSKNDNSIEFFILALTLNKPLSGTFYKLVSNIASTNLFYKNWKDNPNIASLGNIDKAIQTIVNKINIPIDNDILKVLQSFNTPVQFKLGLGIYNQLTRLNDKNATVVIDFFYGDILVRKTHNYSFEGFSVVSYAVKEADVPIPILLKVKLNLNNSDKTVTVVLTSYKPDLSPVLYYGNDQESLNANLNTLAYINSILLDSNKTMNVKLCQDTTTVKAVPGIHATFFSNFITTLEGEYIKYYTINGDTGEITQTNSMYIPDLSSTISLTIGNTQEINALNLEKLNKVSGKHFYTQINYGYGVGTFVRGTGGFAHVTTAYGNDVFYTIGADGSVVKDENYIKPNEPYTVKLNVSDIGTELDQIVGSHIVNAGELIVTGSTGPITYTRTSDSTSSYIYFTDNRKDGKVILLTYEVNTRRLISSTIVSGKFKNEVSIIHINIPVLSNTKIYTPSEVAEMFGLTEGEMYGVLFNKKVLYTTTISYSSGNLNTTLVTLISRSVNVQEASSGVISDLDIDFGSHFFRYKFAEPFVGRETNLLFVDSTSGGGGANY